MAAHLPCAGRTCHWPPTLCAKRTSGSSWPASGKDVPRLASLLQLHSPPALLPGCVRGAQQTPPNNSPSVTSVDLGPITLPCTWTAAWQAVAHCGARANGRRRAPCRGLKVLQTSGGFKYVIGSGLANGVGSWVKGPQKNHHSYSLGCRSCLCRFAAMAGGTHRAPICDAPAVTLLGWLAILVPPLRRPLLQQVQQGQVQTSSA